MMPPRTEGIGAQFANGAMNDDKWRPNREHDAAWLQERCIFWQRQLRLVDWDIVAGWATATEMDNRSGDTREVSDLKKARVRVLRMDEQPPPSQCVFPDDDPEQILVHELLHLHLLEWRGKAEQRDTAEFKAKEFAIDATAEALVRLERGGRR